MPTLTERLALLITADADQAVREFGRVGNAAERDLGNATAKSGKFGGALDALGLSGVTAGTALTTGLAAGGIALAKFTADGVAGFVNLADKVRDFQRASGATTEESSRFIAVLDDFGISAETGAAAVFKLAKTVGTGAADLEKFGVEVVKNKNGTVDLTETLLNVADAYAATTDPVARTQIAFAAFGKQGQQLLPILEKGRQGLAEFFEGAEESGQILSDEDIANAREFELAMDDLGDAVARLQRQLGEGLVPLISDLATATSKVLGAVSKLSDPLGREAELVKEYAEKTGQAVEKTEDLASATGQSTEAMNASAESIEAVTKAIGANVEALDDQLEGFRAQIDSGFAYERSLNALEDAQKEYTEALKGDAEKTQAENAETASRALLSLQESYVAVADAAVRQADDQAKAAGRVLTEADKYRIYRDRLIELKDTVKPGSELRTSLEGLINALPENRTATITVDVDTSRVDALIAKLREARILSADTGNILAGKSTVINNNTTVNARTNADASQIAREIEWGQRTQPRRR